MGRSRRSRSKHRHYGNVEILARDQIYPAEELIALFDLLPEDRFKTVLNGKEIEIGNLRIQCFRKHGLECARCGLRGTFFALEQVQSPSFNGWAVGLYAGHPASGEEVYFTKDHIHPRSKGGPDTLENLQTMCWPCNQRKGDSVPAGTSTHRDGA